MTIRVLVVDDQEMVRTALCAVIDRRDDLRVVGAAGDGLAAVRSARELRPDLVLMDVRMPGMTGVEATRQLLSGWDFPEPAPKVLVLTTFDLDEYVYAALRAGASGFLLKNSEPDDLAAAIRVVAGGAAMLSPSVTHRLVQTFSALPAAFLPVAGLPVAGAPARPAALAALTDRELEVLLLVGRGLSNAQIASALEVSEATVKGRVNRILGRLGLDNRVQAALLVHDTGLLPPP